MNKKRIAMLVTIFVLLLVVPFSLVNAEGEKLKQERVCFGDDGAYLITYDSRDTTFKPQELTLSQVKGETSLWNQTGEYREPVVTKIATKCYKEKGKIKYCPTESNAFNNIKSTYIAKSDKKTKLDNGKEVEEEIANKSYVTMKFNESNLTFNIDVKDKFNGKYKVRYVADSANYNEYDSAANYAGQFLNSDNGVFHLYGIPADTVVALEFYVNDGGTCQDSFVGRIIFFTESLANQEFTNPYYDTTCKEIRNYVPDGLKINDRTREPYKEMLKSTFPMCYQKKLKYADVAGISIHMERGFSISNVNDYILKTFDNFQANIGRIGENLKITTGDANNSKKCTAGYDAETTAGYSAKGKWWTINCFENYTATGDTPKLVRAGDGFAYESTYTITRYCALSQHTYPTLRPTCYKHCSCSCFWTNDYGQSGSGTEGGPSQDFDKCVNNCDGGKYTQSCVNSCYSKVYKKKRNMEFSSSLSLKDRKKNNIEFTTTMTAEEAYEAGLVSTEPGITKYGNAGITYTANGINECSCTESFWCANGHGTCTFDFWVGPAGCRDDAAKYFEEETADAANEYNYFLGQAKRPISDDEMGTYSMTITDTYLTEGGAALNDDLSNLKKFTFYPVDDPATVNEDEGKYVHKKEEYYHDGNAQKIPGLKIKTERHSLDQGASATIKVTLPLSYINKATSEAAYRANEKTSTLYSVNSKKSIMENKEWSFIDRYFYNTPGERKYYSNINSDNFNVVYKDNKPALRAEDQVKYNIKVYNSGAGWSGFDSTISCYYGVYNDFYSENNPCDSKKEVCDGGIQYIFRPIELTDVFPNDRQPRYNWSAQAKNKGNDLYSKYSGTVDPVRLTEQIEDDAINGRDIYKDQGELDYEFILTPKNIKAIKQYNKDIRNNTLENMGSGTDKSNGTDFNKDGYRNYLDYDMTCDRQEGNRFVCISKFLDNTDIVTYSGGLNATNRKSIAGCNNAYNQECKNK